MRQMKVFVAAGALLWSGHSAAQDLILAEALAMAEDGNRRIATAQAQVREQEAALSSAQRERLPSVDFTQRLSRIDPDTVERANSAATGLSQLLGFEIPPFVFQDSYRTQLSVSAPLWTSGALRSRIDGEAAGLEARRAQSQSTRRQVRGRVVDQFYALARTMQIKEARRQALERVERRLQEAERRLEVGLGTRQEVLRWQVEVERAKAQVAAADADGFLGRWQLAEVMGGDAAVLGDPVLSSPVEIDGLLEWAEGLDPHRTLAMALADLAELPEVAAARARRESAAQAVRGAKAQGRPRLDASAAFGWLENETLDLDEFENWSAGLVLTVPLDLRRKQRQEVARQQARQDVETIAVDDALAARRLELAGALADLIRASSGLRSARRVVDEATARRELLVRQTEVGLTDLLDLIDAETTLVEADVERATARVDLLAAVAAIELAWPGADPPAGGLIP